MSYGDLEGIHHDQVHYHRRIENVWQAAKGQLTMSAGMVGFTALAAAQLESVIHRSPSMESIGITGAATLLGCAGTYFYVRQLKKLLSSIPIPKP